ncbi:MAG TPA: hypothetical protein VKP30_11105 [Polyangiaceae bacterium]|nr:hypothetical protein [Polyangiaceae bacterium]
MRTATLILSTCLLSACGPSYTQTVKSPEEMLADQEALADEQARKSKEQSNYADSGSDTTDSEQAEKFDEKYTEMEISRAMRSAVTCPGVSGQGPYGEAKVSITFNNDGHVIADKTTVSDPFGGTANGDCVLRAFNAIITKNFVGQPVTKDLSVKLEQQAKKDEGKEGKKKK